MRWPVGVKILMGFGAIILVIVGLLAIRLTSHAQNERDLRQLHLQGVEGTRLIGTASKLVQQIRVRTFHHISVTSDAEKQALEAEIQELETELDRTLEAYRTLLPVDAPLREQVQRTRTLYAAHAIVRFEEILPASRADDQALAILRMTEQYTSRFLAVTDALDALEQSHLQRSEQVYQGALQRMRSVNRLSLALSGLGVLLALLIAALVSGSISRRLRAVSEVGGRVSRGELDARADVRGSDEIADVASALNSMTASLAAKIEEEQGAARLQAEERARLAASVQAYAAFIERVASGELSARLDPAGNGELRALGQNLETMGEALRSMTLRIHDAVGALSSATADIGTTVQEHATSANETASAVAETAATVDEVQQSAERVTEHAQHVHDVSRRSVEVSRAGSQAVEHTVQTMADVHQQVDGIASRILSLSEQTQAVGHIINTVNELAERSNLLALNAAIEAARAGEAGAGFAVVAQEIRALADQSREATSHVRAILGDVQKSTTEAVLATEEGSKAVARGVDAVRSAGDRIEQLATSIAESASAAEHILTAAQQQAQGVAQISQAMHAIDTASRQTVGGTRIIESASRDLNALAAALRDAVAQYRT